MAELVQRNTVIDALAHPGSSSDPDSGCFIVMYGDELGRRIVLGPRTELLFGRGADCQLGLDDDTVSRHHARALFVDGSYLVRDLGSTNGIWVNGRKEQERRLANGDLVKIGRTVYKFLQGGHLESDYHEVIYQLMINDGLTQSHNRRYFEEQLARELSRSARYERPLALIIFDIDHFKKVNDTHGHVAGDEVLRRLAELVQAGIRGEDVFARLGGEEFAILLPEGTLSGAGTLAERLRRAIEATEISIDGKPIRVTCSFGVAFVRPTRDAQGKTLIARADSALYAAKAAGRNRVESAD